jgi:O-antigen ligase
LGWGGGSFELAFPLYHRLPLLTDGVWDHAHSSYLGLWVELGFLAGSIPILVIAGLGGAALRAFLRSRENWAIGLAACGAVVVAAVHSTVDFNLETQANTYLLVAILALALPGSLNRTRDARAAARSVPRRHGVG